MAEISNPIINKAVREKVRPMAERTRALFINAQAMLPDAVAMVAAIEGAADGDVIAEGREAEGVANLTAGQLRACVGLMQDLLGDVSQDQRLPAVLAACVRPIEVN